MTPIRFDTLVRQYRNRVYGFAFHYLGDEEDAAEAERDEPRRWKASAIRGHGPLSSGEDDARTSDMPSERPGALAAIVEAAERYRADMTVGEPLFDLRGGS